MEVDQQTYWNAEQSNMRKQLGYIDWVQDFLTLDFDHHPAFDDDVCAKAAIQFYGVVNEGNCLLSFHAHA